MNKNLSMVRLDFFSIREYLSPKYLLIFFGFLVLFSFTMDSPVSGIGMFMIYGMFYTAYPFAVAEKTQLDILYASLPLRQNELIFGRYLFALCVNLFTGLISFAVCMAISPLREQPADPQVAIFTVIACFYIYSIMEFSQFPLFFKIGYNKARLFVLLPVALLIAVFVVISRVSDGASVAQLNAAVEWAIANPLAPILLLLAFWLLIFFASLTLSRYFYARREF